MPSPLSLVPLEDALSAALAADPTAALAALCTNAGEVAGVAREVAEATSAMRARSGARPPWIGYLARRPADGAVVGTCAFKRPPSGGAVEIAYFTFPGHEGRGCATAMADALVAVAFGEPAAVARVVVAHTPPEEGPSTRVLRGRGFRLEGPVLDEEDGEVWRWSLDRPDRPRPERRGPTEDRQQRDGEG
jgi:ribosomal-protein-alanine N-acetyltransferase